MPFFWENAHFVHKVILIAIKSTFSFTPLVEIRKNYEAKMCLGLPTEVRQIQWYAQSRDQDLCLRKHWTEPKGVKLCIFC